VVCASTQLTERAYQTGQASDSAHGHAAVFVAGEREAHLQEWRARLAIAARHAYDLLFGNTGDAAHLVHRVLIQDAFPQRLVAQRELGDVVVVDQVLADQQVHQAQRQRTIGARAGHHLLVG